MRENYLKNKRDFRLEWRGVFSCRGLGFRPVRQWWRLVVTPARFEFSFFFVCSKKKKREKERTASPSAKGTWEVRARSRLSKGANERPRWRIFRECHVAGAGQDGRQDEKGL